MNPSGGETAARGAMKPALETNLMERVLGSENLQRAWQQVKSNKGAPGIDGMLLEDFAAYARLH
jgi:RNA-directed DNA polymerase